MSELSGKLSGDVDQPSGNNSFGVELSGNLARINERNPVLNEWDFDITGFPSNFYDPEADELPLDYQVPGDVYIKIQKFDTNTSDLVEFRFYRFQVYRKGFENKVGYLTNEIGYSDPRDCLDAALHFAEQNWDIIFSTYTELNDELLSAGFTEEELNRYYKNKPSFIPDEVYTLNNGEYIKYRKSLTSKLLDSVENEVTFKL